MKIKAVIFDMDGVLIDAREWHYQALNKALSLFGMEISRYDHLITYDGLPTKRKLEMLSLERGLPVELHAFINEKKQYYTMELINTKCHPTFVHQYALSHLRQDGLALAVCSNSIRETVQTMMHRSDLLQYLNFFLSNKDVTQAKPNPEIYTKACEKLKLLPKECLIVEDNENGIAAAKASGANVLPVKDVTDVTYENIVTMIQRLEGDGCND